MNIAVFLSQYDVEGKYAALAADMATRIAKGGHTLIFGGGDEGLMGVIAHAARGAGGQVVGVIREAIKHKAFKDADEMIVVDGTNEMNGGIIQRADHFVVLIGGIGTLNELTAIVRMKKNGESDKGVIIVNTDGFYEGLKQQLSRMGKEGFLRDDVIRSVKFVDTPEDAMRYIEGNG